MDMATVGKFVGNLLHSATIAHFMHLKATNYSAHKALQKYYEGIVDLTDTVAETIQGSFGVQIDAYPTSFSNSQTDPLAYMMMLKDYVIEARVDMPQDSNIQNEIDNIATLLDSTIYKLKFLK
jgi:hypothetical protein